MRIIRSKVGYLGRGREKKRRGKAKTYGSPRRCPEGKNYEASAHSALPASGLVGGKWKKDEQPLLGAMGPGKRRNTPKKTSVCQKAEAWGRKGGRGSLEKDGHGA